MNNIPIIYYHSIGIIKPDWRKKFLTLGLPFFDDQLKYFAKKFTCISLKEFWQIQNGELKSPSNPIVLTFDDGYLDNWQYAYPLLKKHELKGTIFVSPEFVDTRNGIRPNLEDVWNGNARMEDLKQWGFLSWEEMRIMEQSGVFDIQSHTMTHTKYFVSDKLIGFHHPNADSLYYIGNEHIGRKSYYISEPDFDYLLPFGYPIFEMQSAVVARKVEINQEFINYCVEVLANYDFTNYKFEDAFVRVKEKYEERKSVNALIAYVESENEYDKRIRYEIFESKRIIEEKLNKKVEFLCWPHGDNNEYAHNLAMQAGYLATTLGSKQKGAAEQVDRIPVRIGLFHSKNSRFLSLLKAKYKLGSFLERFPWLLINRVYGFLKYGSVSEGFN